MKLIADFSNRKPGKASMSREQLIGLIAGDAKFIDEREDITEYVNSLKAGEGLDEAAIRAGYEQFKRSKSARKLAALAATHGLSVAALQAFVDAVLARRIFDLKKLKHQLPGTFVEVNCATLRGDGAMSALFGHVKGAYTGAAAQREGLLRSANRGLLFLDEIGELGADEQAMLLRALEEKRFLPVGSDREVESDFQLIAGTNRDLGARVAEGRFRDDLLARLNLWTYRLPGLADRREDIEPNLDFELERFERLNNQRVKFNREAREKFLAFAISGEASWLGNFRDLSASVTRMATLAQAGRIQVPIVDEEIDRLQRLWNPRTEPFDVLASLLGDRIGEVDHFDLVQLREVVRVCRRSRTLSEAGRTLFAASRRRRNSTNDADRLRKYLARFGLEWDHLR